jgi:hypothetical protein
MFRQKDEGRNQFPKVIEKSHENGDLSSDKAITSGDSGLPSRFKISMNDFLNFPGILREVNNNYYLSEKLIKKTEEKVLAEKRAQDLRGRLLRIRVAQMIVGISVVSLFLTNLFVESYRIRIISFFFVIIWLVISIFRIYCMIRFKKRIPSS